MIVEYQMRPEDLTLYYERYADRSPFIKDLIARQRWQSAGLSFFIVGSIALVGRSWLAFVMACGVTIWSYFDYPRVFRRHFLKNIQRKREIEGGLCVNQVHKLELLSTGFRSTCSSCDITIPWTNVSTVQTDGAHTIVFFRAGNGLVIAKKAVVSGDYEELRAAIVARCPVNEGA